MASHDAELLHLAVRHVSSPRLVPGFYDSPRAVFLGLAMHRVKSLSLTQRYFTSPGTTFPHLEWCQVSATLLTPRFWDSPRTALCCFARLATRFCDETSAAFRRSHAPSYGSSPGAALGLLDLRDISGNCLLSRYVTSPGAKLGQLALHHVR